MTRTFQAFIAAAILATGASLAAQNVTEIAFDTNANLLQTPNDVFVGEVGGVGANSKGQIFVYTRTGHPYATIGDNRTFARGGSRLFLFDPTGKFVRELGQDVYGFNAAIGLRVDPQDNVWTVDAAASQVVKFDAEGRVALVLGRKQERIAVRPGGGGRGGEGGGGRGAEGRGGAAGAPATGAPAAAPAGAAGGGQGGGRGGVGGPPGSGIPGSTFSRPSDVAWDRAGNIYITDGIGANNRVAKFDKDGRFLKQWGSTGSGDGQFNGAKAIAIDAQGNVYVADAGNKRVQVFDSEGTFKSQFGNIGSPLDAVPLHLALGRRGRHGGRDDLQSAAGRQGRRQVWRGGQAAETIRSGQFDRLPERERAADWRDDELARAEGHAEAISDLESAQRTQRPQRTQRN